MKRTIRIGTRESRLAIVQSQWVADEIKKKHPLYEFEMITFKTRGDVLLDQKLDKIGGKGLFTRELENALLDHSIDIAVHSMKDMPARLPEGLEIAAVSRREDPRDVLISRDGRTLGELPGDAVVGTSSVRRELQLLQLRPDVITKTLRGNVPTRINKLENGEYDAIVLAMAGLKRLGLEGRCTQCFTIVQMVPAVGQGALGIETRKGEDTAYLMESVHDEEAALAVAAEREYMARLNGNCSTPLGAHAVIRSGRMNLYGFLASEDKSAAFKESVGGAAENAVLLGRKLADMMAERLAAGRTCDG